MTQDRRGARAKLALLRVVARPAIEVSYETGPLVGGQKNGLVRRARKNTIYLSKFAVPASTGTFVFLLTRSRFQPSDEFFSFDAA